MVLKEMWNRDWIGLDISLAARLIKRSLLTVGCLRD